MRPSLTSAQKKILASYPAARMIEDLPPFAVQELEKVADHELLHQNIDRFLRDAWAKREYAR